jgi:hypothetical protein
MTRKNPSRFPQPWWPTTDFLRTAARVLGDKPLAEILRETAAQLDDWRRAAGVQRFRSQMLSYAKNLPADRDNELRGMCLIELWDVLNTEAKHGNAIAVGYLASIIREKGDIEAGTFTGERSDEPG